MTKMMMKLNKIANELEQTHDVGVSRLTLLSHAHWGWLLMKAPSNFNTGAA